MYAPTNEAEDEAKETFYDQLQKVLDAVPRHDMLLVMEDWNAKVRARQEGESGIVGKHALISERNYNGHRFVSFCAVTTSLLHQPCFLIRMCPSIHGPPGWSVPEPDRPHGNQVPVQEVSARHDSAQRS